MKQELRCTYAHTQLRNLWKQPLTPTLSPRKGGEREKCSEGDQFAANRGEVQPPHTHGHDQSATLPLLAST